MKKGLSLVVLVILILVMAACGLTAKQTGSKKSSSSAVTPGTPANYSLSVTANTPHGGSVTISPQQEQYISGATVTLTAIPKNTNWAFDKWLCEGDSSIHEKRTSPLLITMDKNKRVIARFNPTIASIKLWDLEIFPSNPDYGTVSKTPDQIEYVVGEDEVTLIATQKVGRVFKGWKQTKGEAVTVISGALNSTIYPTIKIKMDKSNSVILKASFE